MLAVGVGVAIAVDRCFNLSVCDQGVANQEFDDTKDKLLRVDHKTSGSKNHYTRH